MISIIKSVHYYRYFFKYAEEVTNREGKESHLLKGYSHQKSHLRQRAHRLVFRDVQPVLRSQEAMRHRRHTQHCTYARLRSQI